MCTCLTKDTYERRGGHSTFDLQLRQLRMDEDYVCNPPHGIFIEWEDSCTAVCQKWFDRIGLWLYTREVAVGKACGPRNRGRCRRVTRFEEELAFGRPGECFEK
ncbi:uncharacterized protein LOC111265428 [Varroa jacobsoni]|uniref:uncharacterized protein LOC111265428 n=1 Tax=Varroa jacobsoni TaxID=62625 RepID=UPI000BF39E37|nr:uncharacterized protein LOC111265428 [Varroa jacobsoni]